MAVVLPTYDSSGAVNLSAAVSQSGVVSASNSLWVETSFPFTMGQSIFDPFVYGGISFDFGVNNESSRGLALAPKIPFTAATDDLAGTGETATYWTLTLATTISHPSTPSILSYAVIEAAPSVWASTTNTPETNVADATEAFVIGTSGNGSTEWVEASGGLANLVYTFDFHDSQTRVVSGATVTRPFHTIVNDSLWNGLLQFFFLPATQQITVTAATLTGNIRNWHSGTANQPHNRRARSVHDYKTGEMYLSDEAVPDGYLHGIMVHPNNFDPVDPLEDDPYTPPPDEGVVEDEIINLE